MSRALLTASFVLFAAALIVVAAENRYQYFSVVGPSWNGKAGAETDVRRIDRWTGAPQVWVCQDVDTNQVANVPPPPNRPISVTRQNGWIRCSRTAGTSLPSKHGVGVTLT